MAFVPPHILDEEAPPSIVINPHSELGRELRRWEQHYTHLVPPGTKPGNPYVYRPYPKMLYKAQRNAKGKVLCVEAPPHPWDFERGEQYERAILMFESFNKSNQKIVDDEAAERLAKGQGWCESPQAAVEQFEREQQAVGNAAAEVAFAAQRMSPEARAELHTVERTTHEHTVDVKPKRKYTRKSKAPAVAVTGSGEVESTE